MGTVINFIFAAIKAQTPLLLGTTGEIITEKSGGLNLGVEGTMYISAFAAFYGAYKTNSMILALLFALVVGALCGLIFSFFTVSLQANQNVTGLTMTILLSGAATLFGELLIKHTALAAQANNSTTTIPKLSEEFIAKTKDFAIPGLSEIPVVGKLFFSHNVLVYLGIFVAILVGIYLFKTKMGLKMRAVGENPAAADAYGINVNLVKYINSMVGSAICGLGGAYIALIDNGGIWNNGCVNGQGWIAVALVIFARWNPIIAIFGALLFGGASLLQIRAKDFADAFPFLGFLAKVPTAIYVMLPFLITALILIISSLRKKKITGQPASCGVNYFREDR